MDFDLKAANGSVTQFSSLSVKGATVNTDNPATVTLTVGHNSGTATVPFYWLYPPITNPCPLLSTQQGLASKATTK